MTVQTTQSLKRVELIHEVYGGEPYEYYPLGDYVVTAPGVCGGRPTFKYTRLEVSVILAALAAGETLEQIVREYTHSQLSAEAIREAISLANQTLTQSVQSLQFAAA